MSPEVKKQLLEFLGGRSFCVIATVDQQTRPEAAFVAYTSNDRLEIVIGTSNQSRKYQNIMRSNAVALVMADTDGEVQYEGDAEVISVADYEALAAEGRFTLLSGYEKYRNDPTQVYLKISPTWIRFTLHGEKDQITEHTEFA